MKSGLKKTLAKLGVATALAIPCAATFGLVGANAAEAATMTIRSVTICTYDVSGRGYAWLQQRSYVDYDWYEEVVLGKKDYYTVLGNYRTPSVDYKCNIRYA